ncbi:hypothetical protein ACOJBO_08410 [Rhizobium beringeri]
MPKSWTGDPGKAGSNLMFLRLRPSLPSQAWLSIRIRRALAADVPFSWVAADAV